MVLKKEQARESEAPVMDIPVAYVRINSADLYEEPREITASDGSTFTADPQLNCEIEIVEDFGDGTYDGKKFYEKFKLKENEQTGEWVLRDGTKFGALVRARYGQDFFKSDKEFNEEDFIGFTFQAKVEPKENFRTGQVIGSTLNYETIVAIPKPKAKGEKPTEAEKQAQEIDDSEFENIPFS